jgi:hypothetical protein
LRDEGAGEIRGKEGFQDDDRSSGSVDDGGAHSYDWDGRAISPKHCGLDGLKQSEVFLPFQVVSRGSVVENYGVSHPQVDTEEGFLEC